MTLCAKSDIDSVGRCRIVEKPATARSLSHLLFPIVLVDSRYRILFQSWRGQSMLVAGCVRSNTTICASVVVVGRADLSSANVAVCCAKSLSSWSSSSFDVIARRTPTSFSFDFSYSLASLAAIRSSSRMQSRYMLCGSAVSPSFELSISGTILSSKVPEVNILEILPRSFLLQ